MRDAGDCKSSFPGHGRGAPGGTVQGAEAGICHLHRTGSQHIDLRVCLEAVIGQLGRIRSYLGSGQGYLSILLKVIGITYICEFSSGICRDAGYQAVAAQIEVLGKLSVMFAGLPILFAVIEQIQGFM